MLAWLQGEWDHLYKYYETVVHSSLFNWQKYPIETMKINVSIWKLRAQAIANRRNHVK